MPLSKKYYKQTIELEVMKLLEVLREEIKDAGAIATGKMYNFNYDIHTEGYSLRITIDLPDYFNYIDKGVNGVDKSQGSPYSFHYKHPSRKMVDAILKWIKVKNIIPRSKVTGRFIKKEQGAWAIATGIKKNGIEPRKITQKVKKKEVAIIKDIKEMVARGIIEETNAIIADFYNINKK